MFMRKRNIKMKQYYAVLDFEANSPEEGCSHGDPGYEIIEFPVVLCDAETGEVVKEFREFVHCENELSDFIKNLTHITDEQVKEGLGWHQCLDKFHAWCGDNGIFENTTIVTCGDWDLKTMLPLQLEKTGTVLPYDLNKLLTQWVNVKVPFRKFAGVKGKCGMDSMLEHLGLELVGHHHSGIDDCRNIARICHELVKCGVDMTCPTSRMVVKFQQIEN